MSTKNGDASHFSRHLVPKRKIVIDNKNTITPKEPPAPTNKKTSQMINQLRFKNHRVLSHGRAQNGGESMERHVERKQGEHSKDSSVPFFVFPSAPNHLEQTFKRRQNSEQINPNPQPSSTKNLALY
eukprot:TRINITY_DN21496_c0_g2_i3.p2 TRINITY_DN21496_c0_g2~~TRINITY_DN21496_c0_g2_i3.p2  ORF type:complete len:127 (-),score=10.17 TRINITY_DN21496_c0_g2_i3:267-647(-)